MPVPENNFRQLVSLLQTGQTFLLTTHERPDGDALGSMLALSRALERHGKTATLLILGGISERYQFLFDGQTPPVVGQDLSVDDIPSADAVIIIDTGVRQQLQSLLSFLDRQPAKVIVIDHHTHCDLNPDLAILDPSVPAAGILVGDILDRLGWLEGADIAELLLISIASDTGWFSYSNTTAGCFAWADRLTRLGADPRAIHEKLFLSESPQRFRLVARALAGTELCLDDRLVVMTLSREDFLACGADQGHTENLVDQAGRLKTMVVAILFVEQSPDRVRISMRSRDPFDVHQFAVRYGGGGHRRAAGMRIQGSLDQVKQRVLADLEVQLTKE